MSTDKFCPAHAAEEARRTDRERADDTTRKLYRTARWTATRAQIMFRDPVCKDCGVTASQHADHKVPARVWIARRGGDENEFFNQDNLQGLCESCHDRKTALEVGFAGSHA